MHNQIMGHHELGSALFLKEQFWDEDPKLTNGYPIEYKALD